MMAIAMKETATTTIKKERSWIPLQQRVAVLMVSTLIVSTDIKKAGETRAVVMSMLMQKLS